MISPRWQLLGAAVFLTLVAVGFSLLVTESVAGAVVAVGAVWVSLWVHLVLHEGGHLVAALLLRVPVIAVRIAPFGGWRNDVVTRPSPAATGLPARMVLIHLAGPVANLGTAAVLGVVAASPGPALTRLALIVAAAVAVLLGVGNLLPGQSSPNDGSNVLRWLFTSAKIRAGLRVIHFQDEVSRTLRAMNPVDVDPALAAFLTRCDTAVLHGPDDLVGAAERLQTVARADGTDPALAAAIGRTITVQFGLWYLYAAAVSRAPVEHKEVVELSELARLGFDAQPDTLPTRLAMGLAYLLDERPREARALLPDVRPEGEPADLSSVALLLRAVAECHLGNHAEADRLTSGSGSRYEQLAQVVTAIRAADPVPPMFTSDTDQAVTARRQNDSP